MAIGQEDKEIRDLDFNSIDLEILERADFLLSDNSTWSKEDDRECEDDTENGKYSLFCALYKASVDITGEYAHRRPAMQIVRFTIEKHGIHRVSHHRLMDWNNHPETTFEDVKQILQESIEEVIQQIK